MPVLMIMVSGYKRDDMHFPSDIPGPLSHHGFLSTEQRSSSVRYHNPLHVIESLPQTVTLSFVCKVHIRKALPYVQEPLWYVEAIFLLVLSDIPTTDYWLH